MHHEYIQFYSGDYDIARKKSIQGPKRFLKIQYLARSYTRVTIWLLVTIYIQANLYYLILDKRRIWLSYEVL